MTTKFFVRLIGLAFLFSAFSFFAAFFRPGVRSQSKPDQQLEELRAEADRGSATAQNSLGRRYERGKGVPADKTEARKWFLMAANQGDASGKVNLCNSYADELNISDDSDDNPSAPIRALNGSRAVMGEAMKWCGAAANIGLTGVSKYKLGVLYAKGGPGVRSNYEEAYFWLSMSGGEDEFRDKVGKKLTAGKRAEIEQRAKAWKPPEKP